MQRGSQDGRGGTGNTAHRTEDQCIWKVGPKGPPPNQRVSLWDQASNGQERSSGRRRARYRRLKEAWECQHCLEKGAPAPPAPRFLVHKKRIHKKKGLQPDPVLRHGWPHETGRPGPGRFCARGRTSASAFSLPIGWSTKQKECCESTVSRGAALLPIPRRTRPMHLELGGDVSPPEVDGPGAPTVLGVAHLTRH